MLTREPGDLPVHSWTLRVREDTGERGSSSRDGILVQPSHEEIFP
jgi:hypothetical protein